MRIPIIRPLSLGSLLVVVACSSDSPDFIAPDLGVRAIANHPVDRPLQGKCNTVMEFSDIVFQPPPNDDLLLSEHVHQEGTCIFSLFGMARLVKDETLDFTVFPVRASAVLTLITADGDRLTGTEWADVWPPNENSIFEFVGSWTFNGGTGRFANAHGYADFTGNGSLDDLTTQRSLSGRLTY